MKRTRGFSLVELMTVVALIGIIASLAVMSIKRSRSSDDADKWANQIRNTVNMVRRRAISAGSTYMIDLRASPTNRLQWCQVVDTVGSCTTATTTCPNSGTGMENGVAVQSGTDAQTVSYFKGVDLALPNGTSSPTYTAATQVTMPTTGGVQIYFGANGTVDMDYTDVKCATAIPAGVTIYVKSNNKAAATEDAEKRRKIVVYGLSGRPRIIDSW
jgi:prepilin-type N-terminal cleavage/methylation domain-containing protein